MIESIATQTHAVVDTMIERLGGRSDDVTDDRTPTLECECCGERVPRAIYREHSLTECPGEE